MANEELNHIKQILGLQHGMSYDAASLKKLRYGQLMIMTDQDQDGSHIKGLLINFLHHHFPSLLKVGGGSARGVSLPHLSTLFPSVPLFLSPLISRIFPDPRFPRGVHHAHRQGL